MNHTKRYYFDSYILFIMHLTITVTSTLVFVLELVKPIVKIEFNSWQQSVIIK